jgi:hypothetical protein
MMNFHLFNFVRQQDLENIKGWLKENDFVTFELKDHIDDAVTFWEASRRVLPFDPSLGTIVNWDGFADSLFGGLDNLGNPRVSIIWHHAEKIAAQHLKDLIDIACTLQDVASQVVTPRSGIRTSVNLIIFLLGEGANFRPCTLSGSRRE